MAKTFTTADLPTNYDLVHQTFAGVTDILVKRPDGEFVTDKYGSPKAFSTEHEAVRCARRSANGKAQTEKHCPKCGAWYPAYLYHHC